jgi:hypothetical protein
LDAAIETVKLNVFLGGSPLRPPDEDTMTNTLPATKTTEEAMMMALRFMLNSHQNLFVLFGLSRAVPVCWRYRPKPARLEMVGSEPNRRGEFWRWCKL